MKHKKGILPLLLGSALILAGLCLLLFFHFRGYRGDKQIASVVSQMETLLPEPSKGTPGLSADSRMPILEIDNRDYVALVEIPAYEIKLPVADLWDSQALHTAPARFHGSAYDGSLVIGGADRDGQFAFCSQVDLDAAVIVTDMTGVQYTYRVSRVDRADEASAQWLMAGEFDLTLYCRDATSLEYVAVRCTYA